MKTHRLKTWPSEFEAVRSGVKRFEVRSNRDRDFAVGDILALEHWDPGMYEGRGGYVRGQDAFGIDSVFVRVTYILHGGRFSLPEGVCVMSVELEVE